MSWVMATVTRAGISKMLYEKMEDNLHGWCCWHLDEVGVQINSIL